MRPECDFSDVVRRATAHRYAEGANVLVAPALLDVFPDAKSVDDTQARACTHAPARQLLLTTAFALTASAA